MSAQKWKFAYATVAWHTRFITRQIKVKSIFFFQIKIPWEKNKMSIQKDEFANFVLNSTHQGTVRWETLYFNLCRISYAFYLVNGLHIICNLYALLLISRNIDLDFVLSSRSNLIRSMPSMKNLASALP